MAQNPKYINGVFINRRNGQYGEFFSMDANKAELIQQIQSMTPDEKGKIRFVFNPHKDDNNKLSMEKSDWKPSQQGGGSNSVAAPAQQRSVSTPAPANNSAGDDLPF